MRLISKRFVLAKGALFADLTTVRRIVTILLSCVAVAGLVFEFGFGGNLLQGDRAGETSSPVAARTTAPTGGLTARQTWGNVSSLPDHFARHGADFGAKNAEEYARMARQFLVRGQREGLPARVDRSGVLRVYDPKDGAFAAFNRDLTTKTFFKPGRPDYFQRQPGQDVNLRTWIK